jgi:hypothetical protein
MANREALADIRTELGSLGEKVQTMRTDTHHFVFAAQKAFQTQAQSIGAIALPPCRLMAPIADISKGR